MKVIIAGAGISGLATAHALLQRRPDLDLQVLEAASRIGGKVWTDPTPEGYLCEGGVNGFLSKEPKTLQLADALGLAPDLAGRDPPGMRRCGRIAVADPGIRAAGRESCGQWHVPAPRAERRELQTATRQPAREQLGRTTTF